MKLHQQTTPMEKPTPSEAHKGASDRSSSNPTTPLLPPEHMTTRWTKTRRNLFHGGCAASTKQAPLGTNLMLLLPMIPEKKNLLRQPPSPPQHKRTSLTDRPGKAIGSKRTHRRRSQR